MQTLRKKNSPCKFKKEPTRFLGEGVSFKAKLIGILEVSEARGDRMCQAALADLKMAIRAAGEHKQRIAVQVSIDGLRLRDEKTGECLHHHPVHKISFIAQDMSDTRAFGYIFGSPDTGHRFFGIKTDKAANQVVIAMRDLFQVVFELKKKEIELTKQNIEQNASKFHISGIFVEPAPDTKGASGTEGCLQRMRTASLDVDRISSNSLTDKKNDSQTGVIADLLDLQFELNSLQQGIHQIDKITPDNPRPSSEDPFEADPFGDSFANIKVTASVQPILPPPPSTSKRGHLERQQTIPTPSSATSSPATQPVVSNKSPPPDESMQWIDNDSEKRFSDGEIPAVANTGSTDEDKDNGSIGMGSSIRKSPQIDVFTELDPLGTGLSKPYIDKKDFFQHLKNPPKKVLKDLVTTNSGDTFPTNFDITLDSLDPIKIRSNESGQKSSSEIFEDSDFANFEKFDDDNDTATSREIPEAGATSLTTAATSSKTDSSQQLNRSNQRMLHHQPLSVSLPPEESPVHHKSFNLTSSAVTNLPPAITSIARMDKDSNDSISSLIMGIPSPKKYRSLRKKEFDLESSAVTRLRESIDKPFPVDFSSSSEAPPSPLRSCSSDANSRLSTSSAELEIVPEPPPRGAGSILINPPPLPPKKQQGVRGGGKPPPRPPHTDSHMHYDFIDRDSSSPSPTRRDRTMSPGRIDDARQRFDDNFSPSSPLTFRDSEGSIGGGMSSSRYDTMTPTTLSTHFRNPYINNISGDSKKVTSTTQLTMATRPSLDITLSQLTSSNLAEFATSLDMTVAELTSLTLQQLTECLSRLSNRDTAVPFADSQMGVTSPATTQPAPMNLPKTQPTTSAKHVESSFVSSEPLFKADFKEDTIQNIPSQQPEEPVYDKYAVFRELFEMEQLKDESNGTAVIHDSTESIINQESPSPHNEAISTFASEENNESKDEIAIATGSLSTCDLSGDLLPLNDQTPKRESNISGESKDSANATDDDDKRDRNGHVKLFRDPTTFASHEAGTDTATLSSFEYPNEKEKMLKKQNSETNILVEKKNSRIKKTKGEAESTSTHGDREEYIEEEDDEDDEEEEDEDEDEEEEDEVGAADNDGVIKLASETKLDTSMSETKDRYAALREIVDNTESANILKDQIVVEDTETSNSAITSPIQQQASKSLADQDLLKLFSEPMTDGNSPRKTVSRNEDDMRTVTADIFAEIRMLSTIDQCPTNCGMNKSPIRPVATTGFEDVFCPFMESKAEFNKDGRESIGSVKDDVISTKFESSTGLHSDKSSYEGPTSVGGTSPWSPDEKDFQIESTGDVKTLQLHKKQQHQHRLHSLESDNEWKDDEESEESNGKRQFREDSSAWCGRHSRFEMIDDGGGGGGGGLYYEDPMDKERHFRDCEHGRRKLRGGPWSKQAGMHRIRDSSPWHDESISRGWPREEEDPHHALQQRSRYPTNRKQMSPSYKEELDQSMKSYWKCRSKQRPWNGDRDAFRNPAQQQQPQQGVQPHFAGDPILYEDERAKRRMMLWGEEREDERDRDRFSSQESMGYEDEERWSRREYDRRRERWDEDLSGTGGNRFWPRRTPTEADSRVDPRLDPRSEYGPPPGHDMYRKQHYCRSDVRDLRERSSGHDHYVPAGPVSMSGCWPEDDYSLPMSDRPDNSPRYLTRKPHWPKRPNSANDERQMSESIYADPRFKYGMSRSDCSDNDSDLYHRPYRSRSRESYWGSDQEFETWTGSGGGNERLYWSEGPDAKSESFHRRRVIRHKTTRPTTQKRQTSPFEDDFTETIDRIEPSFDSLLGDDPRGTTIADADPKQPTTPRNVKEHLRKNQRCQHYSKPVTSMSSSRGSGYFEDETAEAIPSTELTRNSTELKTTPEDFPPDVEKVLGSDAFASEDNESRDVFFNGDQQDRFDDPDAYAFKSEMADSVPETTTSAAQLKNTRQIKYGNNKMKGDHDIKKSESVNIFVRESDPFDDDDFFK